MKIKKGYNKVNAYRPQQGYGTGSKNKNVISGSRRRIAESSTIFKVVALAMIMLFAALIVMGILITREYIKSSNYSGYGGGGGSYSSAVRTADISGADDVLAHISQINGGNMPSITYGENNTPVFIDGKYSEIIVRDFSTAVMSVTEIKDLLGIKNPSAEYSGTEIYELDDSVIYKLQQGTSGVPVYDRMLLIETDKDGKVKALCCDYENVDNITSKPSAAKPEATSDVVKSTGYTRIHSSELCVYADAGDPTLAWRLDVGNESEAVRRLFVSASDGTLVNEYDIADFADASATDVNGVQRTFGVTEEGSKTVMKDTERGITVYACGNTENGEPVNAENGAWNDPRTVSAAANVREAYDFYKAVLNGSAFRNGKLSTIDVKTAYSPADYNSREYEYAYSYTAEGAVKTILRIGGAHEYLNARDIMTHEFTHSVIRATCDLSPLNESGAINEGYCTALGVLESNIKSTDTTWRYGNDSENGSICNLANPNRTGQPKRVSDRRMKEYCFERHNHADAGCDNGGIHTNRGIINYAVYNMYQNGINDMTELSNMLMRSMNYMVPSSDFKICRAAVMHAAKSMGFTDDKLSIVSDAFREVGIEPPQIIETSAVTTAPEGSGTLTGRVAAASSGEPLKNANINSTSISGSENDTSAATNDQGVFSQQLMQGLYRLRVSMDGFRTCVINNVKIDGNLTTYLENTVLLTEVSGDPRASIGGKVTNAVSGEPVEGAVIHFIAEWGKTSGDYAVDTSGQRIELITDTQGKYFTDELAYGYYTCEITMPGYSTQYTNVIADVNGGASSAQDIVISPETTGNEYRVTLEWDTSPRDLDAHIKGNLPTEFHVFFSEKEAKYEGEAIAVLDHDDTQGNGFETITFTAAEGGEYDYFVHNYSGEAALTGSNAKVKVYQGNVMLEQYNIPTNSTDGKIWNVFKIVNGEIIAVNTMQNTEP